MRQALMQLNQQRERCHCAWLHGLDPLTDAGVDVSTEFLDFAAFAGRAVGENGLGDII